MGTSKPFFSIRRLRWAMVAGGLLLMIVLTGYIGYARYRMHRLVSSLPGRLGIHITQETDHVTYSQTWQGRTVFTLRAAKQVQHRDGTITLHDVGIVLYGRKGDRTDRIHGNEFEYDQKAGIMRAMGEVFIDFAPPAKVGDAGKGEDEAKLIHLRTSGLVFHQEDQFAETDNPLDFTVNGMTGTAVGASYDSTKGVVVLQSQVHVSGLRGHGNSKDERPMDLTASHAEMDRDGNVAVLEAARLVSAGDSGSQTSQAQHAVIHMTADGAPQRVDASGNVRLTGEGRGTITSDKMELDLNASGQPGAAHLFGTVRFLNEADKQAASGKADDARIAFDPQGRPTHAVMAGQVEASLLQGASSRWVSGDKVELALAGGGKEPVVVREATSMAVHGARLRMVDPSTRKDAKGTVTNGTLTTSVTADVLTARFAAKSVKTEVTGVDGAGRTVVERRLVDAGASAPEWTETGTGDVLKLNFREGTKGKSELARAEQRGGVKIVRKAASAKKGAAPEIEHADGDLAVYDANTDRVTMSGGVTISNAESALFADRVEMNRTSGDATADGAVRVSYLQQGSSGEPVHVIAARAIGHKSTGVTEFLAAPGGNARMWQGGSTVEAPVLDFDRTKKTVLAHGATGASGPVVKTVLVEEPGLGAKSRTGPVRILSREMVYTDATREVEFRGLVQVNSQDGVMRSQMATVYLTAKNTGEGVTPTSAGESGRDGAPGVLGLGGRVDHIVATGAVELEQPGRKGFGDKLVYTAADQTSVLTGTKAVPPRAVDESQGTVTGASLRFRSGDDSVEVLSGDGAQRVRTETRIKSKN